MGDIEKREQSYEFNSQWSNIVYANINFDLFSNYTPEQIKSILSNPIVKNKQIRDLSRKVYNTNPIVSNAVDYIVSLPSLSHILTSTGKSKKKVKDNKQKVENVLDYINDKGIIRDFLFRDCLDGACYYYFDIQGQGVDNTKFVSDYEMTGLMELNNLDVSVAMIPLPVDYVKIRGYKNN